MKPFYLYILRCADDSLYIGHTERERQIKRWSRAKKEALIAGDWEGLRRLAVGAWGRPKE